VKPGPSDAEQRRSRNGKMREKRATKLTEKKGDRKMKTKREETRV